MYLAEALLEKPDFIWIDVEEIIKEITADGIVSYTDAQITGVMMAIYNLLTKELPEIHVILYTAAYVIEKAPGLKPLLAKLDHIAWADWPDYGLDTYYRMLAEIYEAQWKSVQTGKRRRIIRSMFSMDSMGQI